MTRTEVIWQARTWLGTPWHHQARLKGVGADCIGVIVGLGRELGLAIEDDTHYARQPVGGALREALTAHLQPVDIDARTPGDVLLFDYLAQGGESHVAVYTGPDIMLHSYQPLGACVEHRMGEKWLRRLSGCFVIPGLERG